MSENKQLDLNELPMSVRDDPAKNRPFTVSEKQTQNHSGLVVSPVLPSSSSSPAQTVHHLFSLSLSSISLSRCVDDAFGFATAYSNVITS